MEKETASQSWRTPPARIKDSEIAYEYAADVVVVGLGNAGTPAVRAAAEAGVSVIGIEKMKEERFWVFGRDVGHINSDLLASRGVPKVDPIELFNEWMRRSGNRANPKLIMQFCQKSGEAFNWYTDMMTQQQLDTIILEYWPPGRKFSGEISGQKFWAGTAQFDDKGVYSPWADSDQQENDEYSKAELKFRPDARSLKGVFNLSHAALANLEKARAKGAELYFSMDAQQLFLEGERVAGVIARDAQEQYVKYHAKKGVILAAGDFGRNKEMCRDLLPDTVDVMEDGEQFSSAGRDGRGIQMGVWAGGRLEPRPLAAMGGNVCLPRGAINTFGALWVDENGWRYCNEGFGDPVFAGFPGAAVKHGRNTVVFDSNILEALQSGPPAHMAFWVNNAAVERQLRDNMAAARASGPEGHKTGPSRLYAADSLEQLADYIGFKGSVKQNFLETVKRYNNFCAAGRDDDFGKDASMLHAVNTPPYYAEPMTPGSMVGFFLVTCGGLLTDECQNVLNQRKDPIPGLYATGNCCGRRFGLQYSTPIAGVSIGIAITLGREVGRIVAEL